MHAPDLSRQPYRRPPMTRATDPQRMNWLWRLVCEVAELHPAEVVEALHATQVPVDQARVRSWCVSDRDDSFFPISIAEMERNLRAVLLQREALRENDVLAPPGEGWAMQDPEGFAIGLVETDPTDSADATADDAVEGLHESPAPMATDAG